MAGALDKRLIMTGLALEALGEHGVSLHEETRIVPHDRLEATLWRDKSLFTLLPFDALNLRLRPLWRDNMPIVDQLFGYPLVFD